MCTGCETPLPGREYHTPEPLAGRAQEQVIGHVPLVGLQQVVIDVLDRSLGPDPVQAERLQFEHHHRPGGVLGQRLVDPQPDLRPGRHLAVGQVRADQLLRDVLTHERSPTRDAPGHAKAGTQDVREKIFRSERPEYSPRPPDQRLAWGQPNPAQALL
jgi:hypothetical protein